MRQNIFQYLKKYSSDTIQVNRLLISCFVKINSVKVEKNNLVKNCLIHSVDLDYPNLEEFQKLFNNSFDLENLIELFEFVISPEDKVINGAVYTPSNIRSYIIQNTFIKNPICSNSKLADISCGCGGFLADSAIELNNKFGICFKNIYENNIYGLDIKEYSIERTKLLLALTALIKGEDDEFQFNLFVGNALNFKWKLSFDIILGNPPYVCSRNIDNDSKKYLNDWSVCSTGHPDLYIPFFQIALELLTINGVMGYITVNSFLKSVNGRALRDYFANRKSDFEIIDFGGEQIFQSRSTYTCICLIQNKHSDKIKYKKIESLNLYSNRTNFISRRYDELIGIAGWNFSNYDLINKIENTGNPFGSVFKTRNGIATLKNEIYIFDPIQENDDFYFLKKDGNIFPIEKGICKNIINPNKFTTNSDIDSIKKKIIFPYAYLNSSNQPKVLEESYLRNKFPETYKYLITQKDILKTRDKGLGNYETWYAFGRNQSLEKMKYKLFFPHITSSTPHFVLTEEDLFFYNGIAVIDDDINKLKLLNILLSSRVFWFYVTNTSKPYSSGYYSLSRNYIKGFGVYNFTMEEIDYMFKEKDKSLINKFIEQKYGIELSKK
jgi:adenine-specific DNA-methyltransferase